MHDVDGLTDALAQLEPRTSHLLWKDFDDAHTRHATPRWCEQRHLVTELDQALTQPYRDTFRAAVFRDGEPDVVELNDVHGGPR
jgi:hypothetical protein